MESKTDVDWVCSKRFYDDHDDNEITYKNKRRCLELNLKMEESQHQSVFIHRLPCDNIPGLAQFLTPGDVARFSCTSKRFHQDLGKIRTANQARRLVELRVKFAKDLGMNEMETKMMWEAMDQDNAYWFDYGLMIELNPKLECKYGRALQLGPRHDIYYPDQSNLVPAETAVGQYLNQIGFVGTENGIFSRGQHWVKIRHGQVMTGIDQLDKVKLYARQEDLPVVDVYLRPSLRSPFLLFDFLRSMKYAVSCGGDGYDFVAVWSEKRFHSDYRHLYINGYFVCTQWRHASNQSFLLPQPLSTSLDVDRVRIYFRTYPDNIRILHKIFCFKSDMQVDPWLTLIPRRDYPFAETRNSAWLFLETHHMMIPPP